jgi:hypothetical protein
MAGYLVGGDAEGGRWGEIEWCHCEYSDKWACSLQICANRKERGWRKLRLILVVYR